MSTITKLEDMSETERQSWMTLMVDVCVFLWFLKQTTYSFTSLTLRETTASSLFEIYVGLIIVTLVLHAIIAAVFETRKHKDHTEVKDERDIEIQRKGAAAGFWVFAIAIHIIIFTLLLEYSSGEAVGTVFEGYDPRVSVIAPASMFFALMVTTFVGDIVKNGTMVLAYRGD